MTNKQNKNPEDHLFYIFTSKIEYFFISNFFFALSTIPFIIAISFFSLRLDTLTMYFFGFISLGASFDALLEYTEKHQTSLKSYVGSFFSNFKRCLIFGCASFLAFVNFYIISLQVYKSLLVYLLPALLVINAVGLGYIYVRTVERRRTSVWKEAIVIGVMFIILTISLIFATKIAYFTMPIFCVTLLRKWKERQV